VPLAEPYHYYRPPALRRSLRIAYAITLVLGVLATLGNASDGVSVGWSAVLFGVVLAVFVAQGERTTIHTGLEERADGFVDHGNFGSRFIALADVERFEEGPGPFGTRVWAVCPEGRPRLIQGVFQGRRVAWDGGETRDIISVLNERLAAARS
jgi:hypothetical protein